jgi:hypothetical protein
MKLTRLAIGECCNHITIVKATTTTDKPHIDARYLTRKELEKVVDIYNTVAEAAEGSNNLPYQMTFQLLKEGEVAESIT